MEAKKVLGVIAILIVIVYAVSGLKGLINESETAETEGQATAEVDYTQLTNQLVYNGQNLDIEVVEVNGTYYFPLIELGEQLNFKVNVAEDGNISITNGTTTTVIKSETTVFIDGEEHNKAANFQPVNNYMVPLDFVRVVFGVEFDYSIDQEKNIKYFYMTGPDVYDVMQDDLASPHLVSYTKDGKRDLGLISDKSDLEIEAEYQQTEIESVTRTENSDIITTNYTYSGAVTSSNHNVLYVRKGSLVDNTNLKTTSYIAGETLSTAPTQSYDNRVAFLNIDEEGNTVIKIYDDTTGTLVSEIDTINQYGAPVYNIQAVGKDFLVVGMYGQLYDDEFSTYYTAVINLNTNEVIPVYEKFGQAEKLKALGQEDMAAPVIQTNEIPYDGIVFNFVADDGSLKFTANNYGYGFEEVTPETINITLSE